jgi:hypothetical protein
MMNLEHAAAVKEVKRKVSSAASDAERAWKSRKLELKSARDNAVARADVGDVIRLCIAVLTAFPFRGETSG